MRAGFGLIAAALCSSSAYAQTPGAQADAYFDRDAMAAARAGLKEEHGGAPNWFLLADRLEVQSNDGAPALLFDGQGWWGTDRNKLWVKSEVERDFDAGRFEEAELQALWSRPVTRFFDVQAGVRHDFVRGADRTFGVLGVQGLAPYWFEIDAALFVSGEGDVSARFEAEYDLLLTQRLILQPRTELNFAVQEVEEVGVGSGLSTAEIGLRLRYEIRRQFAPYVGVNWERRVGETAALARADGATIGAVSLVGGLRLWL
ncbi:MAG: copper resistance protein B [Parvularculaceae bacterium]|nr:copper resistance protein B [Parvularculaceae bacterium]